MSHQELRTLRAFRSGLDAPPPGALDRIADRAFAAAPVISPRRPRVHRLAIPAVVAGVLAVLLGVPLLSVDDDRDASSPPSYGPASSPTARERIEHLATLAGDQAMPAAPRPDQVIALTTTVGGDESSEPAPITWLERLDPQGTILLDRRLVSGCCLGDPAEVAATVRDRADYQRGLMDSSPNLCQTATPQTLRSQAIDPASLRAALAACPLLDDAPSTTTAMVVKLDAYFSSTGAMAPPVLNAAFLRLLAAQPDIRAVLTRVGQAPLWAIGAADVGQAYRSELLVAPDTGRVVGARRLRYVDPVSSSATGKLTDPPLTLPRDRPVVEQWELWTARLVQR
jgi:hypothetical protein